MSMTESSNSAPSTETPVAGPLPECPTLTSDQGTWLKKNYLPDYMQAIDAARAKKPNTLHVRGPGKDFVKNHVLNVFIDQFWDHAHEPNTASVMQKVKKYLKNHYKTFDKKSGTDHQTQPPPHRHTNAKEQFCLVMAEQINLFHEVLGDMWEAIGDAEHQKYQAKADELNVVITESPALQYIYEMQSYIAEATEADLSQLIGFQHNQFGKVAWVAHCMYKDKNGEVQHTCIKVHSKSKSWGSIPDNDLHLLLESADKLVKPSDSQQPSIVEADNANYSDPTGINHSKTKPRMKKNKKNSEKESNAEESSVKEKEKERAMRDAEESAVKEREEKETTAKETKGKHKPVQGQKHPNDTVNGDVNAPPAKKQGRSAKNTIADDSPPSPPQPRCSAHAGKGENPSNYKLIGGKYVGK
ncbi:hypothetical protein EDD18DRAFT_1108468 [Armillaria luteobubalina]|uniref:Uncharacterized protein n=1 Tax=Armillaria luteobubalina TaxID=153913 RepID=A0AA39PYC2_9AGAR|nr:hypothetical protein EDD18DRAFT_1108468 [Armillaria luteobubalina]